MNGPVELAERLVQRASALPDPQMRVAYVRHEIGLVDPATAADLALVVATRAEAHEAPYVEVWMALCLAMAGPEGAELKRRLAAGAAAQGHQALADSLRERPGQRVLDDAPRVPDFGKGRPLTLGERKSLARTHDRQLIARALRDPHPDVVRILLGNPMLTEDDVVRLAATRPASADTLREVFRTPRWVVRRRVRMALVLNPYTPTDLSMQLLPSLTRGEARRVAQSTELADALREAAARRGPRGESALH